jgi:hypothetical protein
MFYFLCVKNPFVSNNNETVDVENFWGAVLPLGNLDGGDFVLGSVAVYSGTIMPPFDRNAKLNNGWSYTSAIA